MRLLPLPASPRWAERRLNIGSTKWGAGHPPALWYRAREQSWELLEDTTPFAVEIEGLPLGLIPGITYSQTGVRLESGDLVLYTDGISDSMDASGNLLGFEGSLEMARRISPRSPAEFCRDLIATLAGFRNGSPPTDDETLVVLQRVV